MKNMENPRGDGKSIRVILAYPIYYEIKTEY
jgi:hypothetical protein